MALAFPASGARAAGAGELFVKGHAYLTGQGEPRDATRAAAFFLDAARQGEPQAQFQLGVLFMEGLGVPADVFWAYYWLGQAMKSPALPEAAREQATGRLAALGPRLSQDQRRRLGLAPRS
jgi:TPR repeat protein